jgi:hypothetical protein
MTVNLVIEDSLREFLASQDIEVLTPRKRMLELKSVPIGPGFSKPCTNLLMWDRETWRLFVDDDLKYSGDDSRNDGLLAGPCRKRWQPLSPTKQFVGDVNNVLLSALELLNSPLREMLDALEGPFAKHRNAVDETDFELKPGWYAELFDVRQFDGSSMLPTDAQADAIDRIVLSAMRRESPICPVLVGPSGSGKSVAARLAAERLVKSGAVRDVFVISGASLHAGISYEAERDERLTEAFAVAAAGVDPLIIFEQIDLLLVSSKLVRALTADLIDRGVRLIGITQAGFDPIRLRSSGSLPRRVEFVWVDGGQPSEMLRVIAKRLENWPLSREMDVLPEAAAAAVALSARSSDVEPAGSMGLLESVLIDARERGVKLVGPDEVFHTHGRIYD